MILKILEIIAKNRLEKEDFNNEIQLSKSFINKAIAEFNKTIEDKKLHIIENEAMNQFKIIFFNKEWIIKNRAYRDNTNDFDFEEELYKIIFKLI